MNFYNKHPLAISITLVSVFIMLFFFNYSVYVSIIVGLVAGFVIEQVILNKK